MPPSRVVAMTLLLLPLAGCSGQAPSKSSLQARSESPQLVKATASTKDIGAREKGEDWPLFLGPRGDGTSAETGVDPSNWKPHPPLVWTVDVGTGYSGPVIADGRLLQFDRQGDNERLTCYEATTGNPLWTWEAPVVYEDMYGYNQGPRCSPIIDEDRVYTYGVAGQLSCVDLASGEPLWSKNLVDEYGVVQNFFGVSSHPCIYQDLVLVMVGGSPAESQRVSPGRLDLVKPNGTAVVAFNKLTGEEVYRVGDDLASYSSLMVRSINGQDTGLGFMRSGLLAWEPKSGDLLFQFPWRANMLESVNAAQPVTNGNQILLSEAYQIGSVLLNIEGRRRITVWQDKGNSTSKLSFRAHWATPVLIDGFLYGCSGRNEPDSDLRCVRWQDGEVQWTDRDRIRNRSSLVAVDGYLVVLGELGLLELIKPSPEKLDVVALINLREVLDPRDSKPLLSPPCWFPPVLSHGLLYLRGADKLVCLDLIPE